MKIPSEPIKAPSPVEIHSRFIECASMIEPPMIGATACPVPIMMGRIAEKRDL